MRFHTTDPKVRLDFVQAWLADFTERMEAEAASLTEVLALTEGTGWPGGAVPSGYRAEFDAAKDAALLAEGAADAVETAARNIRQSYQGQAAQSGDP